jgi:hypothetical protein
VRYQLVNEEATIRRGGQLGLAGSTIHVYIGRPFKGTVSPDITFYFRFCKIKSVLSVRPLRVF